MNNKSVFDSVEFVDELAQRYNIIYIGVRSEKILFITQKRLHTNGFPDGKVFLAAGQSMRLKIAESILLNESIVLGIGDRWDDNQLHLILGCKSIIAREYCGDFDLKKNMCKDIGLAFCNLRRDSR